MSRFDDLIGDLARYTNPNVQGRTFECLCLIYLRTRFRYVWRCSESAPAAASVPPSLDLSGGDTGVDFYAIDTSGALWAIQAKSLLKTNCLQKRMIDSFIADAFVRGVEHRMVVTSAKTLSANVTKYMRDVSCEVVKLNDLRNADVEWPPSLPLWSPSTVGVRAKLRAREGNRWLPYDDARTYARALKLRSHKAWLLFCRKRKKRLDVPANPSVTYRLKGWLGWGDFLGTGNLRKKTFRDFAKAHEYSLSLGFHIEDQWRSFARSRARPFDIPANPDIYYKGRGWRSWQHWLTGVDKTIHLGFELARQWARSAGIPDVKTYRLLASQNRLPRNVPRSPATVYRNHGWKGWGDFLGTGAKSPAQAKDFLDFEKARARVRDMHLESHSQWRALCRSGNRPREIPSSPDRYYRDRGWKSWGDFLGTNRAASGSTAWLPFKKARSVARLLGLTSREQWRGLSDPPDGIPRTPDSVYKEWAGWEDWLGFRRSRLSHPPGSYGNV